MSSGRPRDARVRLRPHHQRDLDCGAHRLLFEQCLCRLQVALEAITECLAQEVKSHGIKVALVEPGIIDSPMATSSLPEYKKDSIYPHGRRMHAIFKNPDKPEASPTLVGDMIRYVIESNDPRLALPRRSRRAPLPRLARRRERRGLGGLEWSRIRRRLLSTSIHGYGCGSSVEVNSELAF